MSRKLRTKYQYQQHQMLPPLVLNDYDEGNDNQDDNDHTVHDEYNHEEEDEEYS